MAELNPQTKILLQSYREWNASMQPKENLPTIHVDEVASRVAAFYEKIRGIIDWKEENRLKRGAIERMLKRRLFSGVDFLSGTYSSKDVAEPIVLELVRGGHFPNDKIEEGKIKDVQRTIDKYVFILNNSPKEQKKSRIRLCNWISSIAACEIEAILTPSLKERALIDYMFVLMKERIKLNKDVLSLGNINEQEKNIQVYISVHKALFNLDSPVISYHLLKYRYLDWENLSEQKLIEIAKSIYSIWDRLEKDLNHPLGHKFYQVCEKYDTPYLLLGDIATVDPLGIEKNIIDPENLESLIKGAYNKRLKTLKSRLARAAFYSTLSIFLTNIVSLLAIEIPFTKYVTGSFNPFAIGVDIFVPTLLMAFLVMSVKPPRKGNLEKVIMETIKIVYKKESVETYGIKLYRKRGIIFGSIIKILYCLSFSLFLSLIIWGLYKVKFPILSHVIFIIFLSLIAFAGAKIRQRAKELHMLDEKEALIHFLIDPFAVPVVQLGKWLTIRWKRYNIISALFNALIDMPFLLFIEFLEQWRYFLKEKKERIH